MTYVSILMSCHVSSFPQDSFPVLGLGAMQLSIDDDVGLPGDAPSYPFDVVVEPSALPYSTQAMLSQAHSSFVPLSEGPDLFFRYTPTAVSAELFLSLSYHGVPRFALDMSCSHLFSRVTDHGHDCPHLWVVHRHRPWNLCSEERLAGQPVGQQRRYASVPRRLRRGCQLTNVYISHRHSLHDRRGLQAHGIGPDPAQSNSRG